jgi:hypothetical protein
LSIRAGSRRVTDDACEAGAFSCGGPLQHLKVAV